MGDIGIDVIGTGGKRRQRGLEFQSAPARWMQMSKGARRTIANQKQMHHFAVVRNERRPLAPPIRGVHRDGQNVLVTLRTRQGRHGERLVERIVPVVGVFEVPPFLAAKNQESEDDCSQRHGAAATPPVFLRRTRSGIETALT